MNEIGGIVELAHTPTESVSSSDAVQEGKGRERGTRPERHCLDEVHALVENGATRKGTFKALVERDMGVSVRSL